MGSYGITNLLLTLLGTCVEDRVGGGSETWWKMNTVEKKS